MNKGGRANLQNYRQVIRKGIGDRPIRFKCSLQNTIIDVLRSKNWVEVKEDGDFDLYWADVGWMKEFFDHFYMQEHVRINHFRNHYEAEVVEVFCQMLDEFDFDFFWADRIVMKEYFDSCHMQDHVRINHFRNHYELTRKNLMVKNLKRYRKQLERDVSKVEASRCDFFPMTFELPSEYHMFVDEFKRNPGSIWIMKPVAKSQGKGIFLFKKLKDIMEWKKSDSYRPRDGKDDDKEQPETYIVSRYIERPYLIGGRKFDLRVYVLVTSYIPLRTWLYRSGFARFSNSRFSLESIDDTFVHLTNVAVQKTAPDYDPEKGCKWSLQQLRQYLTAKHDIQDVEEVFRNMNDIFIKSLHSVQKIMINDKHCFELYGYDILLGEDLKPWLIEVNASPSLTASSQEDYILKFGLLEDMLHIIDMENRLTGKEKRVGGFDLMWDDGPVMAEEGGVDCISPPSYSTNTFLGCYNDRKRQLRQLYKHLAGTKKT